MVPCHGQRVKHLLMSQKEHESAMTGPVEAIVPLMDG